MRADDLAAVPLKALLARNASLDPAVIEEMIYGCAIQTGYAARAGAEANRPLTIKPDLSAGADHSPCANDETAHLEPCPAKRVAAGNT